MNYIALIRRLKKQGLYDLGRSDEESPDGGCDGLKAQRSAVDELAPGLGYKPTGLGIEISVKTGCGLSQGYGRLPDKIDSVDASEINCLMFDSGFGRQRLW